MPDTKKNNTQKRSPRRSSRRPQRNQHREKQVFDIESWKPKTATGEKVKNKEINDIDQLLDRGIRIHEAEIVDALMDDIDNDLLLIGQSKGKFGGGQRRVFRQTQKKTREGNKPKFSTVAIVGNKNGYIGVGYGKSKETVPAREKAVRNAKLSIRKIKRGCGSWQCGCKEPHSIPYKIEGKCGSVIIKLIPAPKGTGLVVQDEIGKILSQAGIKDIWCKTKGKTKTRMNMIQAVVNALQKLVQVKVHGAEHLGIVEGKIRP